MPVRVAVVVVVTCIYLSGPAFAQPPSAQPPLSLTVEDAVSRGLVSSHRIAEVTARHEATEAVIGQRRAPMLPQVAALAAYTRTNHVDPFGILLPGNQLRVIYPDVPDNYRTRLDVQYPLYTGGRLQALTEAARKDSAATSEDIDALRADLTLEITRAFWNLVVADESSRVVEESLTRTSAHLRDVRNQLEAGLVPPSDVLSVEAQESRQRMLNIQARSSRDVAEAELGRVIGVEPGTPIRPSAVLAPIGVDTTFDALVGQARERRADRQALLDRLTGAELRQRAAAAGNRPSIGVGGGVDYARPNPRIFPRQEAWKESWDASVNLSWPLFDGGRTSAEIAEAVAARRGIQARLDELDSVISLEIRQRIAEIQSSRAAIAAAEDAVRAATEARRVIGERFTAGVATSTDVLDAQMAVLQASLDRTQALANAHLADARLHRAIGQ
jgi:outer membrane protein TolC